MSYHKRNRISAYQILRAAYYERKVSFNTFTKHFDRSNMTASCLEITESLAFFTGVKFFTLM